MSYRVGIVLKTESEYYAQVVTDRKSACGECQHNKMVCYGCLSSPKIVSRVANPVGAKTGDLVRVHLAARKLFIAAAMFYLMPIVTLIVGASIGEIISTEFDVTTTAISGSMVGFLIGLIVVTILGRLSGITKKIEPAITSILISKEPESG